MGQLIAKIQGRLCGVVLASGIYNLVDAEMMKNGW